MVVQHTLNPAVKQIYRWRHRIIRFGDLSMAKSSAQRSLGSFIGHLQPHANLAAVPARTSSQATSIHEATTLLTNKAATAGAVTAGGPAGGAKGALAIPVVRPGALCDDTFVLDFLLSLLAARLLCLNSPLCSRLRGRLLAVGLLLCSLSPLLRFLGLGSTLFMPLLLGLLERLVAPLLLGLGSLLLLGLLLGHNLRLLGLLLCRALHLLLVLLLLSHLAVVHHLERTGQELLGGRFVFLLRLLRFGHLGGDFLLLHEFLALLDANDFGLLPALHHLQTVETLRRTLGPSMSLGLGRAEVECLDLGIHGGTRKHVLMLITLLRPCLVDLRSEVLELLLRATREPCSSSVVIG